MKAYYGSRISEHMTETPEGFLVCRHVPIARTGYYDYLPDEIGAEGTDLVRVFRSQEEVFSNETMASFEGKPVAMGHPPGDITPSNSQAYQCGHVQNVRRGQGDESSLLLADLFITDKELIRRIKGGLREVSCGYNCDYEESESGGILQRNIRGNHVAVVEAGRAGSLVSIKDCDGASAARGESAPTEKSGQKERKFMAKSLLSKLFGVTAKDADPEAIAELATALTAAKEETTVEQTPPAQTVAAEPPKEEKPSFDAEAAIGELKGMLEKLCESVHPVEEEKNPLDVLEKELSGVPSSDVDNPEENNPDVSDPEKNALVRSDNMDEECAEETKDEETEEAIKTGDRAALLATLRVLKPIIAALPEDTRKRASDEAAKAFRLSIGKSETGQNTYAHLAKARAASAAKDSAKGSVARDPAKIGRDIMARRNPHYKATT